MKTPYFVLLGCLLAACGQEDDSQLALDELAPQRATAATAAEADPSSLGGDSVAGLRDVCARTGHLDFRVKGRGLSRLEGRRVVVAAYENATLGGGLSAQRVVLRSGVIRSGAFSLSCDRSLRENYAYPSWAAYVDADGNGVCNNGDLAYQMQLYGWNRSVDHEIAAAEWLRLAPASHRGPLGSRASDFCSGYFGK
ncbi:MAG: hypothetical protein JNJ46_33480 [Myxococcales bacterium]|nr:hypothetical protein [Myxococcales bacterium]